MHETDVILVNYNGADDTIMCIKSLWKMTYQDFRIVIIENGSADSSFESLQSFVQKHKGQVLQESNLQVDSSTSLVLIRAESNRGFASGNNIGMKLSLRSQGIRYVWLLNNDTIVDEHALSAFINAHKKHKQYSSDNPGILGSRVRFYDTPQTLQAVGGYLTVPTGKVTLIGFNEEDSGQYNHPETYDMVLGASMFVDIDFIKKVGTLNEDYFLYFEELDWSHRARQLGFPTRYEPTSIVYHKQGKATGNSVLGKKSQFAMYHMYRSLLIFYRTYYPQFTMHINLRIIARLIKFQLKGQLNAWPVFRKIFLTRADRF